jgi:DNA-binding NarL/FixJ family response regulator
MRVLIADDHPPTRAGVKAALSVAGFEVCAEVGDAAAAVEAALRHDPDVCLLDIHMPGNGIAAAARITSALPEVAVVMLTVSRNDSDLFDALRAGASGYLLKDMDPDRLPDAIKGVLRGEAALPRALAARVIEEFRGKGKRRAAVRGRPGGVDLTSREWEVLNLMCEGLSTGEIADRLFVSATTVRSHVSTILKKLHVSNREEAISLIAEDQIH